MAKGLTTIQDPYEAAKKAINAKDGPGIPRLLEHLSEMVQGPMFLWYSPPPAGEDIRWRVWYGVPTGSGGGEWGRGHSALRALHDAYERIVDAIFEGRVQ